MSHGKERDKGLKGMLKQYELINPVPEDVRKQFSSDMGPAFKRILKRTGAYGIVYGLFLSIYFFFRRFGITITVSKLIISFLTVVSVLMGGYFLYLYINTSDTVAKSAIQEITREESPVKDIKKKYIPSTLSIEHFTTSTVNESTVDAASDALLKNLAAIRGTHFARYVNERGPEGNYSLLGNIEKVENNYIVFIKIVSLKDSSIIYAGKEKARTLEELDEALGRIARRVSEKLK